MKNDSVSLLKFAKNLYHLLTYDYKKEDKQLRKLITCNDLLGYYSFHDASDLQLELQYVSEFGVEDIFPYAKTDNIKYVEKGMCTQQNLPYVIHKGRRLYFSQDYALEKAEWQYRNYIETEQLLGAGYMQRAPHCYLTNKFNIEKGDVVVDVGSAEGLLSLDNVMDASHIYLVEADPKWIPALKATFEPWKHKCTIVNKFVSDHDDDDNIRLDTLLADTSEKPLFIKMDIEGNETHVLKSAQQWLTIRKKMTKIACCTYHYYDDAAIIEALVKEMGYSFEYSDGYMSYNSYDKIRAPFFKHGLIRAWKE
jgi:hypothetical protein